MSKLQQSTNFVLYLLYPFFYKLTCLSKVLKLLSCAINLPPKLCHFLVAKLFTETIKQQKSYLYTYTNTSFFSDEIKTCIIVPRKQVQWKQTALRSTLLDHSRSDAAKGPCFMYAEWCDVAITIHAALPHMSCRQM